MRHFRLDQIRSNLLYAHISPLRLRFHRNGETHLVVVVVVVVVLFLALLSWLVQLAPKGRQQHIHG